MASIYRRGRIYWIRWYAESKKHYRSLKTSNKRVALYRKAQIEQEILQGRHAHDGTLPFSQAIWLYVDYCKLRNAEETWKGDETRLHQIEKKLGPAAIHELKASRIEDCIDQLGKKSVSARNRYLKVLRTMGNWLVARGHLFENFTKGIQKLKEPAHPRTWLTTEQRDRVLALAKKGALQHYPMIAVGFFAGLRLREILTLEWQDVDFEQNIITVRPKPHLGWNPKSKKYRKIPLHPRLKSILKPIAKKEGICFPAVGDSPYKSEPREKAVQRLFEQIGVRGRRLGWHVLRHSFASNLVQAGVSVYKVSEWLGHSDTTTTQIYAHLAPTYDQDISRI